MENCVSLQHFDGTIFEGVITLFDLEYVIRLLSQFSQNFQSIDANLSECRIEINCCYSVNESFFKMLSITILCFTNLECYLSVIYLTKLMLFHIECCKLL
jgi:hypothetical protein